MILSFSRALTFICAVLMLLTANAAAQTESNPIQDNPTPGERVLLWGDTHLHTKYSGDAYALENRSLSPDDAYRFAKGQPVIHPYNRTRVQLETPLDFLVVSDHAEYMGLMQLVEVNSPLLKKSKVGNLILRNTRENKHAETFFLLASSLNNRTPFEDLLTAEIRMPVWEKIISAADGANDPGNFTALIGWEWSSLPNGSNLHRVVFTPDGGDKARAFLPFSSLVDDRPEALWAWLEQQSAANGTRFVAIPHNSNISTGLMFDDAMSDGETITRNYARTRMVWEPVVEMIQVKGASETHPSLSPNDEFAGFEIFEHVMSFDGNSEQDTADRGNYIRGAMLRGLEVENTIGVNPYKFGVIGSTDSHTGLSTAEENNFWGKYGLDSTPENKFEKQLTPGAFGIDMGAQGLAAVWADENTRDGIYEAFKRKEVYATTGPRINLRFFGGWKFKTRDANKKDIAEIGYRKGVAMGGDLAQAPDGKSPRFLVRAVYDPNSAYLDRIQIIKGWVGEDGAAQEKIFNVALSDDRDANADGTAPSVGDSVDRTTATYDNSIGDPELSVVWEDPEFDASQRAFYYARILEIPTPRHSLFDAVAMQEAHPESHSSVIQERAFSSPIWYTPDAATSAEKNEKKGVLKSIKGIFGDD